MCWTTWSNLPDTNRWRFIYHVLREINDNIYVFSFVWDWYFCRLSGLLYVLDASQEPSFFPDETQEVFLQLSSLRSSKTNRRALMSGVCRKKLRWPVAVRTVWRSRLIRVQHFLASSITRYSISFRWTSDRRRRMKRNERNEDQRLFVEYVD